MSGDRDYEWPTFDDAETRDSSYSPDSEREKIFTEFKLATDTPRNKKRKPKKSAALRLTSETEVLGNRYKHRDCRRVRVIAVAIAFIIIFIGVAVGLGIYFGVVAKPGGGEDPSAAASQDTTADVQTTTPTAKLTSKVPNPPTLTPTTRRPTTQSLTTKPTTASTTTPTTTTTTPTTTTTTTTAAPTKPPTLTYSLRDEATLVASAAACWEKHMFTFSNDLSVEKKCGMFSEKLQCVFFELLRQGIYCPNTAMVEAIKNNSNDIIPLWSGFNPDICTDMTGSVPMGNVSVLPEKQEELCSSQDAVSYYWNHDCFTRFNPDKISKEPGDNKCRLFISVIGCIARTLGCLYDDIKGILQMSLLQDPVNQIANQTYCDALNETAYQSNKMVAECSSVVYQSGSQIFDNCNPILELNSVVTDSPQLKCKLNDEFTICVELMVEYPCSVGVLKELGYEMGSLQSRLLQIHNLRPQLINVSACDGHVQPSKDICGRDDALLLLAMVDTKCSEILRYALREKVCDAVDKFIKCATDQVQRSHRETCTHSQILQSMQSKADKIKQFYNINISACS